ncbi:MAG: acyltransferase [Gammaproteobacteria bacterium MedPE]|nr:MAG: acyltransferase [Gammaproteobacteria bacterium MedPE]
MSFINGILSGLGYIINTVFWFIPIFLLGILKLLPMTRLQQVLSYIIDGCASGWIKVNTINQRLFSRTIINTNELPPLSTKEWYMVIANHQSWVDILVLQRVLDGKVPFLKFFLKQQLIFVPIIGLAWWALDFPFMKRYSKALLAKKPHLRGKDVAATQKSCEKFQLKPVSVVNFVEGTRFTQQKSAQQGNPYSSLLRPKAGGCAFALNAMSGRLNQLVNVTIAYPNGIPSFWDFICGRVNEIKLDISVEEIDAELVGDYENDLQYKARFQQWLNDKWQDKQITLDRLK